MVGESYRKEEWSVSSDQLSAKRFTAESAENAEWAIR
jgi:hypothetical protein